MARRSGKKKSGLTQGERIHGKRADGMIAGAVRGEVSIEIIYDEEMGWPWSADCSMVNEWGGGLAQVGVGGCWGKISGLGNGSQKY